MSVARNKNLKTGLPLVRCFGCGARFRDIRGLAAQSATQALLLHLRISPECRREHNEAVLDGIPESPRTEGKPG